jgi:hypothetical protein
MRPEFELADAVRKYGSELHKQGMLKPLHIKVLDKISQCRTSSMGGHEEACTSCGTVRYSYNSCGDRHCPKCQAAKQALWIDDLLRATLPVKHYHIVFTVPHELNAICLFNDRNFYEILFASVWNTLSTFSYTQFGAEGGAVCVLHTWGQNLSLHPHIHCIVPAAGYSLKGEWKNIGGAGNFLYSVRQMSEMFKGKFLDRLKRSLRKQDKLKEFDSQIQTAYGKKWVVHCEPSLADAAHVVKYLGQYTHRVAITNQRILGIKDGTVTFMAKDYRDNAIQKPVTLSGAEFLRRFCLHILPQRFVKIRRYGIYNHTVKRNLQLQFTEPAKPDIEAIAAQKQAPETRQERFKRITGIDVCQCPACKTGRMVTIRELPRIRSPSLFAKPVMQAEKQ